MEIVKRLRMPTQEFHNLHMDSALEIENLRSQLATVTSERDELKVKLRMEEELHHVTESGMNQASTELATAKIDSFNEGFSAAENICDELSEAGSNHAHIAMRTLDFLAFSRFNYIDAVGFGCAGIASGYGLLPWLVVILITVTVSLLAESYANYKGDVV